MSRAAKPHILVADDEADVRDLLREALEAQGFIVETASDGAEALAAIRASPPDLAVLDLNMPRADGFAVCRGLREDPLLQHLPVIMLSGSGTPEVRIEGIDLGADDFLAKPVNMAELLARVRMILKRTRQGLDANPLTRLPGNVAIETRVDSALAEGRPLAVLYVDIDQFKSFNDAYGYDAGDQVIKATARMLMGAARELGGPDAFVGHIGGDDFIVVTRPELMEPMARRVLKEFDAAAPSFYSEKDRRRGKLVSTDRQGRIREFPLLSLSIGICHNSLRRLSSYAQVSQLGAELKGAAKRRKGSSFVIDRRKS